jgi:hypothetical protein
MSLKYTPGPWRWRAARLENENSDLILEARPSPDGSVYVTDQDASLISAAPDLVAAARIARHMLAAAGAKCRQLDAAIEKAERQ